MPAFDDILDLPDVNYANRGGSSERLPAEGIDLKEQVAQYEINLIRQALEEAEGVVAHAAKLLGMRRTTLVEKLRKYGIQKDEASTN